MNASVHRGCSGNLVLGARVLVGIAGCGLTSCVRVGRVCVHVAFLSELKGGRAFGIRKCFHCVQRCKCGGAVFADMNE